jgi:hypothetical protein
MFLMLVKVEFKRGLRTAPILETSHRFILKVLLFIHQLHLVAIAALVICEKGLAEKPPFLGIQNFLANCAPRPSKGCLVG